MKIKKETLKNYVGKKIRGENWASGSYVELSAVGKSKILCFLLDGTETSLVIVLDWETYEEPKQKVKMWQALYVSGDTHSSSLKYYASKSDAIKDHKGYFIQLLPHTEIEVEV